MPLIKNAFTPLPLGTVKANGFLQKQLELMRDGITGNMPRYRDYNDSTSRWLGAENGDDWENGVYYLRGLIAQAFVTPVPEFQTLAKKWIDALVNSQRDDGYFGPKQNDDWWPRMPALWALRDWYEATNDKRIIPLMERYFEYQLATLPSRPLRDWGQSRGADNIDVVLWLYDKNGDERLIKLANLLKEQTFDWANEYHNTGVRQHVVNTSQGLKYSPAAYRLSGSEFDRNAFFAGLNSIRHDHGRTDGLPNSDEAARDHSSVRGTETCGVVEAMLSTETALRTFGTGDFGDYLEKLAYNSLPNCYDYDYTRHCYYFLQNNVMATHGYHGFDCDHGDSSAFGTPSGFDCCFANNHMGWAKFVQHMWMKSDDGLALTAYGPCSVSTVISNKLVSFTEETSYPFRDTVSLTYNGDTADFTLSLRIPRWSKITFVNGEQVTSNAANFFDIAKTWNKGDIIEIKFTPEITVTEEFRSSSAITRGALIYCLPIKEKWVETTSNSCREIQVEPLPDKPMLEVFPASQWNYGLVSIEEVVSNTGGVPDTPFSPENAPISLKATGQLLNHWFIDGNVAAPQPINVLAEADKQEDLTLIPYACTRLKITHLPTVVKELPVKSIPESITAKAFPAFRCAQIEFSLVEEAQSYNIHVKGLGWADNIRSNPYKGGGIFKSDRYTIDGLESGKSYEIKVTAVKDGIEIAESNVLNVVAE